jgi:hypothetical protein
MKRNVRESLKKQVAFEQQYKCLSCNILLPSSYQIDHVIPHSISGDDTRANLVALCPTCHANKTQNEYTRIMYFKRMVATHGCQFCYFCLERADSYHYCSKVLSPIPSPPQQPISSLYKFAHVNNIDNVINDIESIKLDNHNVLKIFITNEYIKVNNYSVKVVDKSLTPKDLGNIVRKATLTERSRYTEVHIDIIVKNDGGAGGDACIEYFSKILPSEMPDDIFKTNDVSYVYFCDDD